MAKFKELTSEKKTEIRFLYQGDKSVGKMAARYGVAKSTVQDKI